MMKKQAATYRPKKKAMPTIMFIVKLIIGLAFISPLFVGKEFQKQGVARKLIQRAINDVGADHKIGLDTQNPVNLPFYEKMGFEMVGHVYYEDKDIDNYYLVRNP